MHSKLYMRYIKIYLDDRFSENIVHKNFNKLIKERIKKFVVFVCLTIMRKILSEKKTFLTLFCKSKTNWIKFNFRGVKFFNANLLAFMILMNCY